MKTAVVIPNWNGRKLLEKNLPKVLRVGFDEVIIVDDGSSDDSVQFITLNFPVVMLIQNSRNLGFSKTVNKGVAATSADVVFLLNSDVIPKAGILPPVLAHLKDPNVFGVSLREVGYWWARPKLKHGFIGHEPGTPTYKPHSTFWVSGGSGAFRKSMWNKLSGMDTLFSPFYWEDIDLSYRALKRGWKLVWEPKAVVEHKHELTINPSNFPKRYLGYIKERNQLLFQWKHLPTSWLFTKHFVGLLWRLRHPGYLVVVFLALLKLPLLTLRRLQEMKRTKLVYEDIFAQFGA